MPATADVTWFRSRFLIRNRHVDPNSVDPVLVLLNPEATEQCIALRSGPTRFAAKFVHTIGTGAIDGFEIIGATAADGTGATVVKAHATPTLADAPGDELVLECDVEQVREALSTATHIGVRVEFAVSTDEGSVTFIGAEPRFASGLLTTDYIS
jgi:hypothetical protein